MEKKVGSQDQENPEGHSTAERGVEGVMRDRTWVEKKYNKMFIKREIDQRSSGQVNKCPVFQRPIQAVLQTARR